MRLLALCTALGLLAAAGRAGAADGPTLFAQNCALCHQSGGAGLAGQFPRLAGRVGPIARQPEGRAYLIDVLTYGMVGQVVVDDVPIVGVMPALRLGNDDAAAVLSFVASLGGTGPILITADEVAAQRTRPRKSATEVRAERQALQNSQLLQ